MENSTNKLISFPEIIVLDETFHKNQIEKHELGGAKLAQLAPEILMKVFDFCETPDILSARLTNKAMTDGASYGQRRIGGVVQRYIGKEMQTGVTQRWQIKKDGSIQWCTFDFCWLKKAAMLLCSGSSLANVYDKMKVDLGQIHVTAYSEKDLSALSKLKAKVEKQCANYNKRHGRLYKALAKFLNGKDLNTSLKAVLGVIDSQIQAIDDKQSPAEKLAGENIKKMTAEEAVFTPPLWSMGFKESPAQLWMDKKTGAITMLIKLVETLESKDNLVFKDHTPISDSEVCVGIVTKGARDKPTTLEKVLNFEIKITQNKMNELEDSAKNVLKAMEREFKKRDQNAGDALFYYSDMSYRNREHDGFCKKGSATRGGIIYE